MQISCGSVQSIVTEDLCMRLVSTTFVPKLFIADQNDTRISVTQVLLDCVKKDENVLKNGHNRSWVYGCDSETEAEFLQWETRNLQRLKKA